MFYELQHFGSSDHFCREYGVDLNFPKHLHRAYELAVVLSGSMTVTVDEKCYTLSAGDGILIFPNQIHSFESSGSEDILFIFSPEAVSAFDKKRAHMLPTSNKMRIRQFLIEELKELSEKSVSLRRKGVLYSVLADFDEGAEYYEIKKADRSLLFQIFEFVERSYNLDCTLKSLAESISFGYSYLSRYFKKSVGMTFNSYVNSYRISKACYLLKNTESSVLECSLECGYRSLRSFNRNFKMCTGLSPMEYRDSKAVTEADF